MKTSRRRNLQLNNDYDALEIDLADTEDTLADTQTELADTEDELADTEDELSSTKTTLASTQTELSSTKTTLASTLTELSSTKATLADTEDTLTVTLADLAEANASIETLNGQLSELNLNIETLQADYDDVCCDLEDTATALADVEAVYPPRHFISLAELENWLTNHIHPSFTNLVEAHLELQRQALADGYRWSVSTIPDGGMLYVGSQVIIGDSIYGVSVDGNTYFIAIYR